MLTILDCIKRCSAESGVTIWSALRGSKLVLLRFNLDAPAEGLHLIGARLLGLNARFADMKDFERELWAGGNVWVK